LVDEVPWIADQRRVTLALEEVAEEMVLAARGDLFVVDDGDGGPLLLPARLAVALDQRLQQPLARAEATHVPALLEPLHHRKVDEELDQDLVVRDAGRALRVELHEAIRVRGDEGVP